MPSTRYGPEVCVLDLLCDHVKKTRTICGITKLESPSFPSIQSPRERVVLSFLRWDLFFYCWQRKICVIVVEPCWGETLFPIDLCGWESDNEQEGGGAPRRDRREPQLRAPSCVFIIKRCTVFRQKSSSQEGKSAREWTWIRDLGEFRITYGYILMLGESKRATQHRTFIGTKMREEIGTQRNFVEFERWREWATFFALRLKNND